MPRRLLPVFGLGVACAISVAVLLEAGTDRDGTRPEAAVGHAERPAAPQLFGARLRSTSPTTSRSTSQAGSVAVSLRAALARVRGLTRSASLEELRKVAVQAADARIRMAALRGLAAHVDDQTLTMLVAVVRNSEETDKVRAEAARLLGRTGEGALAALVGFLRSNLSVAIRTGVLRGLAELGSPTAVESVLEVAQGEASHLRPAAIRALAEVRSPEATPLLTKVAGDASCRPETRVAVCRALAEAKDLDAVVPLKELLADREAHADVRAAAVEALGRIGGGEALSEVVRACGDPVPAVALEARIARSRIEHVSPR